VISKATDEEIRRRILSFQRNEITEHKFYAALSKRVEDKNSELLRKISEDELRHYHEWKKYTGVDATYSRLMFFKYLAFSKIFGLMFAIKLMERGEKEAEEVYSQVSKTFPKAREIMKDEEEHENILIGMIDEERVKYVGSLVLGVNDALVELTGTLAGLTLTLQINRLVGIAGIIMGLAASLSMSASEYLSQKSEKGGLNPLRAALYTGVAYILAVIMLTTPYLIVDDYRIAIAIMLSAMTLMVFILTFFISVVKEVSFKKMLLEMILISLGVAAISFIIGWIARFLFNIEV